MVNEEILTALKNAIERDEDLNDAGETLINAGYSSQEVEEAKNFLTRGVLSNQPENFLPEENSEIPKEGFFDKINNLFSKKSQENEIQEIQEKIPEKFPEVRQEIKSLPSSAPKPYTQKSSSNIYLIILIIILLILIFGLISLLLFKEQIISLFS